MNAVGVFYLTGKAGVTIDNQEALKWFKKSAEAGYPTAWFNIGIMYKNGLGVEQDFEKAFTYISQSVIPSKYPLKFQSYYTLGYLTFKGLGVAQNYPIAIKYFRKGIVYSSPECMYMLGLCFRNGYGVKADADSAKYWLNRAVVRGSKLAKEELLLVEPENPNRALSSTVESILSVSDVNLKAGYQKISHNLLSKNISGHYTGHLIKFDWSGKYIIDQVPLTIDLEQDGKNLSGQWNEKDIYNAKLSGKLTDSCIVFENTNYSYKDHYNTKIPNALEFRKSFLKFDISSDTVYLTGTLQLYSKKSKEPEKPIFLVLIKEGKEINSVPNKEIEALQTEDHLEYLVFPNPFNDIFQIKYKLKNPAPVRFVMTSVLSGKIIYNGEFEKPETGEVIKKINVNAPSGWYVLTQFFGQKHRSSLIYKN